MKDPILGAVGALQLEVLQYRLEHEYGAQIALERLPYQVARWIAGPGFDPKAFELEVDALCIEDRDKNPGMDLRSHGARPRLGRRVVAEPTSGAVEHFFTSTLAG